MWYVIKDDQQMGPFDTDNLRYMHNHGKLDAACVVKEAASGRELSASELQAVLNPRSVQPTAPPPVVSPVAASHPQPTLQVPQGYYQPPQTHRHYAPPDPKQDPLRFVIPVNPSGLAIAAGYLGIFSMIGIAAPFAIIVGYLAIRDCQANPSKTGIGRAWFGLIAGVLFTIFYLWVLTANPFAPDPYTPSEVVPPTYGIPES
ncbi:MAG: hypothetical protein KF812_00240 [Fimbriimonadaceae bacterium]|nr:hypothetical protein [Fimbriimonadaceae bacterium]